MGSKQGSSSDITCQNSRQRDITSEIAGCTLPSRFDGTDTTKTRSVASTVRETSHHPLACATRRANMLLKKIHLPNTFP